MKKLITLLLVLTGMVSTASARWVGNSAINVNGTWYYCGNSGMTWCSGGAFNGKNLGTVTSFTFGGQSQVCTDNSNWGQGTMTMGYKIDNGSENYVTLTWYKYESNNNFLQSGGSNFTSETIDITILSPGNHTIEFWFYSDNGSGGDQAWDSNNSQNYKATFTIPATQTITIPASGKGTYSSPYNLDFTSTSTVSAYTVSALSSTSATLTKLTQTVPAGTGLIVMGSGSEDISVVTSATSVGTNYLHATGTSGTTVDAGKAYILSSGQFHPANAGTIPANKAYLKATDIPSASGSRSLNLVYEETTGINATQISNDLLSGDYYNLAGQRVTKPSKGLYIVNGKKVIIK